MIITIDISDELADAFIASKGEKYKGEEKAEFISNGLYGLMLKDGVLCIQEKAQNNARDSAREEANRKIAELLEAENVDINGEDINKP